MDIRAKRREDKISPISLLNKLFSIIRKAMIFITFLMMPVFLVWSIVLTFMQEDILSVTKVVMMLLVCLYLNIHIDVK